MIKVSEAAKEKIIDVLISENANYLRFGLQGGGCNGFQYFFQVEKEKDTDDLEVDLGFGRTLLIDAMSMTYLDDAEIDYKRDLMGESFVFNNPNTATKCGCGNSVGF